VAVIGFDDIAEATYSTPALSSVAPDTRALAHAALDLLTSDASATTPGPRAAIPIPFTIAQRASTIGGDR
jgi:DNA-binding LacI/PurR family transcriptional regulator